MFSLVLRPALQKKQYTVCARAVLLIMVFSCICGHANETQIIPEHGRYSDVYQGNWSVLPNGKLFWRKKLSDYSFSREPGEKFQKTYYNESKIHLKDIALQVHWKKPYEKYGNTLFLIRGCDQVIVENVAITQLDPDYRASHSIFVEDCKQVIIRNCYFSGTSGSYHVRIEGCEEVFIDNVEISGFDYGENGVRCGGGIFVNNGDSKAGGNRGMVSPNPKDMKWCVIQNCYIHDNLATDKRRNQDGILIHSASDGIVFNCYFENWKEGDASLDVSHRRADELYRNHIFRVERNIFDNADRVKTPGNSHPSCKLFFANNLYINTFIGDYHRGWDVHHVNETYIFEKGGFSFFRLWGMSNGSTHFRNCLLYVEPPGLHNVYFQGENGRPNEYRLLRPDFLVYIMPKPLCWLGGQGQKITAWEDWQNDERDRNSHFQGPISCFVDPKRGDYRLLPQSPATNFGCSDFVLQKHPGMKVERDFCGVVRSEKPSAGAFEVIPIH